MTPSRPAEKLEAMTQRGFIILLDEADGNLAEASYRLAILTNAVRGYVRPTPTAHEVYSAAKRIAHACEITMWSKAMLINAARALGFDVL